MEYDAPMKSMPENTVKRHKIISVSQTIGRSTYILQITEREVMIPNRTKPLDPAPAAGLGIFSKRTTLDWMVKDR